MRTIDGFWRPGSKKAESLLSDVPSDEEKEAFVIAKLDEVFKNQVGHFVVFKAEMLDHFLLSIDKNSDNNSKEDFCKAYYKIYNDLGGAMKIRRMGLKSMHMSYKHLHRGFWYWLFQNKYAVTVMLGIMALNVFIFDLNLVAIKVLVSICVFILFVIEVRSYYISHHKLKVISSDDPILVSLKVENHKVFGISMITICVSYLPFYGIDKVYALIILLPLVYVIVFYNIFIVKRYKDLTSKRSIES